MTGIFVRVKRRGKWEAAEIETLTENELRDCFKESDKDRVLLFFAAVTKWMREHIHEEPAE